MKRKRPPFIAFFLKGLFNKPRNDPSPTEIEMVNMVSSIRPFMKMIVEKDFSGLAHASSWATTYTPEQITQLIEGIRDEIERYRLCLDPIEVRRLFGSAISLDGVSAG